MNHNSIYEDLTIVLKRVKNTQILFKVLFVILVVSFWKIQILEYQKYWKKSEANHMREIMLSPQRGLITDRNGVIIAKNIACFKASIIKENSQDLDVSYEKISYLLNLEEDVLRKRVERFQSVPIFYPIVVKDNLTQEEISRIEARQLEFPELMIEVEPKRFYPFNTFASHIIGYLQEISQEDIKNNKYSEKGIGDLIGKTGIEKQYESILVGKKGKVLEIVDSSGRKKGELLREEPVKGKDIRLSLDFDLQKKAEDLLDGREGAIIVLSPKTGEILSMASYPSFDPNKFINRFSPEEWQEIASSPDFPLENRVIRGLYSPGSIFKLAMALAALDLNEITEKTSFICNGSILIYGHPFSCWYKPGHGPVNLTSAIQHSCNIYFYLLGKNLGIENIAKYAKEFGFGTKTGIDLPEEKNGLVPDPRWKEEVKKANWFPGETISISIGQGPLLVTPLQIADFTALIANRGKPVNPHLVIQEEKNEFKTSITREIQTKIDWSSKSILFEKVIEGMWKSVNAGGTGRLALIDGYDICGKTGSTQIISTSTIKKLREQIIEIKTHSWFTGFAPKDNPKVVVTVLVEYGGMGGQTAAPIARKLFTLFKEKYD